MPSNKPSVNKVNNAELVKKTEFSIFLHILESGQGMYMKQIAEALGVAQETISDWNKDPRAIEARTRGITRTLEKMSDTGKRDWRMWDRALDRAGMTVTQKQDLTSNGNTISPILSGASVQGHHGDPQAAEAPQED